MPVPCQALGWGVREIMAKQGNKWHKRCMGRIRPKEVRMSSGSRGKVTSSLGLKFEEEFTRKKRHGSTHAKV